MKMGSVIPSSPMQLIASCICPDKIEEIISGDLGKCCGILFCDCAVTLDVGGSQCGCLRASACQHAEQYTEPSDRALVCPCVHLPPYEQKSVLK